MNQEIANEFKINLEQYSNYDLLIDLENEWKDADSYQIQINGVVREIEMSKVSKEGNVLFLDSTSKQATVVSNKNNKSTTKYEYTGEIISMYSIGADSCLLLEKYDNLVFVYKTRTKKKPVRVVEELKNNEENLIYLKNKFEDAKAEIKAKNPELAQAFS